ncbi:MAG: hypothetical protein C4320_05630 [Armatimonadota bacterium]
MAVAAFELEVFHPALEFAADGGAVREPDDVSWAGFVEEFEEFEFFTDAPVVAAAGLLGIVQTVSAHESTALLITSTASTLGAIAPAHDPPPAGLVRGENSTTLTVTFADPNAPIKMGDALVTTGYSELVPRGLLIGRVIQVNDNPEMGSRTARVYPAVQIGRVREVAVLR